MGETTISYKSTQNSPENTDFDAQAIQLTAEQKEIVFAQPGHLVINAVAGSGKTTTLAWRIRYLLEQGQDPRRLMVLMYNRSAKLDFEKKLAKVCSGLNQALPEIRTYHAAGLRLCKRFAQEGHIPAFNENLLGEQQVNYQLWLLLQQHAPQALQSQIKREKKQIVAQVAAYIEQIKSSLLSPEIVFDEMGFRDDYRFLIQLFHTFEQWRNQLHQITYSDMLYLPVKLLQNQPQLVSLVANKMDHILVDEYQDTNEVQHQLLKLIAGDRAKVSVVGDPDQTIYEFRGARPEYILHQFATEFPGALQLNLSYSFRYGHSIALLANHLISHNKQRKNVLCYAHPSTPKTEIKLVETSNDAIEVINLVLQHQRDGGHVKDMAVLCRVWTQTVPIELELLAQRIPYKSERTRGALQTTEAKAIMAVLSLASGHFDFQSPAERKQQFDLLFHFPHLGIPSARIEHLCSHLAGFNQDWGIALKLEDFSSFKPFQQKKLMATASMLKRLAGCATSGAASMTAHNVLKLYEQQTSLIEGIRSLAMTDDNAEERVETINGFFHYLERLNLPAEQALSHLKTLASAPASAAENSLTLSTIHRAKGLEYPVVIIPGLDNQHLPYQKQSADSQFEEVESERRLFYVAMTRAIDQLFLLCPPLVKNVPSKRSRFIKELSLPESTAMSDALNAPQQPPVLSPQSLNAVTPIGRQYAAHFNWHIEKSADETGKSSIKAKKVAANGDPLWHNATLMHLMLGLGEVIAEEDKAFRVRFENGETMNFSKETASRYFKSV